MTHRTRGWIQKLSGQNRVPFGQWSNYVYNISSLESEDTEDHGGFRYAKTGDVGGPWFLKRAVTTIVPITLNTGYINGPAYGDYVATWSNTTDPVASLAECVANGTKAIGLSAPNNPAWDMSQFLGELRSDGLPALFGVEFWKERTQALKGSGSEYLNTEFGWKPLVSDVQKFARAVKQSHKIVQQYSERANKRHRVRHSFLPINSYRVSEGGNFLHPSTPVMSWNGSTTERITIQSWFSGAFRYYIPLGDDQFSKMRRWETSANKLLGSRLTPYTLWEIAPWLWATDWFANTGDIMRNISNLGSDGTVMDYGYSMLGKTTEVFTTFNYQGHTGTYRFLREQKRRIPASPYGFVSTFDGLTNRQKAICAALGITRVR